MGTDYYVDEESLEAAQKTFGILRDTQHRMGEILELMLVGLVIHQEQTIVFANREAARLLGETEESLIGRHLFDFIANDPNKKMLDEFKALFSEKAIVSMEEAVLKSSQGDKSTVRVTAGLLPWDGVPVAQVLLQDITELKKKERQLFLLSITDPLTGSFNRGHFIKTAAQFVEEAREKGANLSLALIDVDHFKQVNDSFGHAAGDRALVEIVEACNGVLKLAFPELTEDGIGVSRLGGEEFAFMLPTMDAALAVSFLDTIRKSVEGVTFTHEGREVTVTISIGVAVLEPENDVDILLAHADSALYKAKELGRNQVVLYRAGLAIPPVGQRVSRSDRKKFVA